MKKNSLLVTLIAAVLIVVMSFTVTACDVLNRVLDSIGGGNGTLKGLDESKLSDAAKADKDAQELALMIDDEFFENPLTVDYGKCVITREDLTNLFAELFKSSLDEDSYRVSGTIYIGEDGSYYKDAYFANCHMHNILKSSDVTMKDYISNESEYGELVEQMRVTDEDSQTYIWKCFQFGIDGMYGADADSEWSGATVREWKAEIEEEINSDEEGLYKVYGNKNMTFIWTSEGEGVVIKGDNIFYSYELGGLDWILN